MSTALERWMTGQGIQPTQPADTEQEKDRFIEEYTRERRYSSPYEDEGPALARWMGRVATQQDEISQVDRERQREQFIQDYMARTGHARWMAENAWWQKLSEEEQRVERARWHRQIEQTRAERTAAILDLLMRGEYASAGFTESLLSGDILGALPAAWRGLTGRERITYGDIFHERLPESVPDWAKTGGGLLAGILLDPTTWLGVGGLTRAGRAAQISGELAPTLAGRISAGQQGLVTFAGRVPGREVQSRIAQAVSPVSQRLRDSAAVQELVSMFSTRPLGTAAKVEEIIRNREQISRYLVDRAKRRNVELAVEVMDLERRMGVPPGTIERHITREVERARPETMLRALRREVTETVPVTETVMKQAEQIRTRPQANPEWYELWDVPVPRETTPDEIARAITDELALMRRELESAVVEPGGISRALDPRHGSQPEFGDVVYRWGTVSTTPPWFRELGHSRDDVMRAFDRQSGALYERLIEIASDRMQHGYREWITGTEVPPRFIPEHVTEVVEVPEQVTRQVERTRQVVEAVEAPWELTMQYEIRRGDTLSELAQRHNTTVDEILALNPQITDPNVIRAGDTIRLPAPEETTPLIESIRAEQPARLAREQAAGLSTTEWLSDELEYFGRVATPEFENFMRQRGGAPSGEASRVDVRHGSQRPRHLPDLPIEELNRANREGRLGFNRETGEYFVSDTPLKESERAFRGYSGDLFETNPFVIEYVREARSVRAIQASQALEDIRRLGLEEGWIREAPGQLTADGTVQVDPRLVPDGWELLRTPALGDKFDGLIVRSDIAPHIKGYYEKATNKQDLHWSLKTFDAIQNWWKAQTLSPFPSYHARNVAGDVWNNFLADVSPRYYGDAAFAMAGRDGHITIRSGPLKGQTISYDEAMELASMHGALETGFFHTEFRGGSLRDVDQIRMAQAQAAFREGNWREALRRYRQAVTPREFLLREINPFHHKGLLVRGGRAFGQALNNHTRLAHFMDRLAKGFTPEDAARSVNTFLFDYRDVTRFEADVMRRIAPFYTWSRKNLPLQFRQTLEQPRKMVTPLKAERDLRALMGAETPDPEEIPDYIRESFPHYLGQTEEGMDRWWTSMRWWPWAELFEPLETPGKWAGGMLTPILRVPIEMATNYDLYFQQPIVPTELRRAGETRLRNFLGMSMPASVAHILGQQRLLSELDRLNPWNIFGEERPYRNDPEHAARWVRFLTGMNIYEVDPVMTAMFRRLDERNVVDALVREAQRAGRAGDEAGREYILQRIRQRLR